MFTGSRFLEPACLEQRLKLPPDSFGNELAGNLLSMTFPSKGNYSHANNMSKTLTAKQRITNDHFTQQHGSVGDDQHEG